MAKARRDRPKDTEFRRRRIALGFTADDLAKATTWSRSKFLRVELDPPRARHADVLLLIATLGRLEQAVAGAAHGAAGGKHP